MKKKKITVEKEAEYGRRCLDLIGLSLQEGITDFSFLEIKGVRTFEGACLYLVKSYFDENFEAIDEFKANFNFNDR